MKILYIVDSFPSVSIAFILNHIEGMIERGHEVRILSRLRTQETVMAPTVVKYKLLDKTEFMEVVPTSFGQRLKYFLPKMIKMLFSRPALLLKSLNPFSYGKQALALRVFPDAYTSTQLKENDFDVIHAQFGNLGLIAARMRELGGLRGKIVTHFRGFDLGVILQYHRNPKYYQYLFERGELFLANSNFFYEKLLGLGAPKDRTFVHYSGTKVEMFPNERILPWRKDNQIHFGTVGRLVGKKGYPYIFEALARIKQIRPEISFTYQIVGNGPDEDSLKSLVARLGLQNEVTFLGAQNHDFVSKFLRSIDVFLSHNVTSENGDQDAPVNTIKEAFLCELPVISTLHGGIPELVKHGENGLLSAEKEVEAFAQNMLVLADNPQLCRNYGTAGRKFVIENFENQMLLDKLESFYEMAINRQAS